MSKLDRQIDEVFGERRVQIDWPGDDEVDVDLLRLNLISEIDSHLHRVPLDLRGVHGAPETLVDLLIEMQRYAISRNKVLSISASLPPMQQALNPRRRRKAGRPQEAIDQDGSVCASDVAKSAIASSRGGSDPNALLAYEADTNAEKRVRSRAVSRKSKRRRHIDLALLLLCCTGATAAVYWYFSAETAPLIYDQIKTFEKNRQERKESPSS